jgi:hypothetical protein
LGIKRKIRACSVADWTATMIGQKMPDGKVIQPHKTPKLEFCTVADGSFNG